MASQLKRIKRGDIVSVLFPNSDLRSSKIRPVLVVQADSLNAGLSQLIVAMVTSNLARLGHPSRVSIPKSSLQGQIAGLPVDSDVMLDNLVTIKLQSIQRWIGRLDMTEVDQALAVTSGLDWIPR